MPEKKVLLILCILTVVSIVISLVTVEKGNYVSILNAICVGFFGSSIFYFFVVYLPERQKRKRVRNRLQEQYTSLKLEGIDLILMLSNSQSYQDREKLLDQQEFRRFFNEDVSPSMTRWHALANGLQENEYHFRELLYYLRMINDEIRYAMTTIDIHDEEVNKYLKNCSQVLSRLDILWHDYDDIKLLCRNLWSLYTGFSFVEGYKDRDVIQEMINRIE